jgi:hypothetical protein
MEYLQLFMAQSARVVVVHRAVAPSGHLYISMSAVRPRPILPASPNWQAAMPIEIECKLISTTRPIGLPVEDLIRPSLRCQHNGSNQQLRNLDRE